MNLRIRSLHGRLSWNQCLLRSTFTLISWVLLFFPFLEMLTHPNRRAWQDRVSDTDVIDMKSRPSIFFLPFRTDFLRAVMVIGMSVWVGLWLFLILSEDKLELSDRKGSGENVDSLVASFMLRKDFSESSLTEVDEIIWSGQKRSEKSISYFLKLQIENDEEVKVALAQQICEWTPSELPGSLCSTANYLVEGREEQELQRLAAEDPSFSPVSLTAQVFWMKELTRLERYQSALALYKGLKRRTQISASLQDSLDIWNVSLFWKIQSLDSPKARRPASLSRDSEAGPVLGPALRGELEKFIEERVEM
jgi:hypothetical protein